MASICRLLRFGILILFIWALCTDFVVEAKNKKRKKKKHQPDPEIPEVSITRYDLCQGCLTTTELLHEAIREEVERKSRLEFDGGGRLVTDQPIDGIDIASRLCAGPKFAGVKDELRYACIHLMQENATLMLKPFIGNHDVSHSKIKSQVLHAKREVCGDISEGGVHACTANHLEETFTEKTPCAACQALVKDVEFLIYREKKINRKILETVLEPICAEIPMRHASPAYMEEVCDEIMDEIDSSIISVVNMRLRLQKNGLGLTDSLAEKVCGEMAKICPSGEEKDKEL